jgi:hypothetical protein
MQNVSSQDILAFWFSPVQKRHWYVRDKRLQSIDKLEEYCFKHPNDLVMNEVGERLGAQ